MRRAQKSIQLTVNPSENAAALIGVIHKPPLNIPMNFARSPCAVCAYICCNVRQFPIDADDLGWLGKGKGARLDSADEIRSPSAI